MSAVNRMHSACLMVWPKKKKEEKAQCNSYDLGLIHSLTEVSPVGSVVNNLPAGDTRDAGSFPGSGRSPREGNGNPLQEACLENPMDRGAWWATVHGVTKSQTQQSMHIHTHISTVVTFYLTLGL